MFLSQKAQALKVVKDKLKKLDIDYLYGYIPNRSSPLYSIEEEADGAAYTLSGLSQYINEKPSFNGRGSSNNPTNIKEIEESFSESINTQREFTKLRNRYLELQKYLADMPSVQKYYERFDEVQYKELKDLEKIISDLSTYCGGYIKDNPNSDVLDKKYELVLDKSEEFEIVLKEYAESARITLYDRDGFIASIANKFVLLKLKPITDKLPKEIYDDLGFILNEKTSKSLKLKKVEDIKEYFTYKNSLEKHKKACEEYELKLVELGLDHSSLKKLEALFVDEGVSEVIALTKEVLEVVTKISDLTITDPNSINKELKKVKEDRKTRVRYYVSNIIRNQITASTTRASIRGTVARIAKALTKSKKAYRTFDNLKKDPIYFKTIKELVPVWIMDLEDASRLIPLEKNLFDYIILDEASQCNLAYALPAMYRSKRVIFFGDSLQMRDDSIKFKTNRSMEELAAKFHIPEHLQIKSKDDSVKSVLDIGTLRGFKQETLLCHYRSPKEIIGFSNDYFYAPKKRKLEVLNTNYLPAPNTNRILTNHVIKADKSIDISEKTNMSEVLYIVKLIQDLKTHPSTCGKSIGVLTFFNEQAILLKEHIKDDSIKVSVIEGIQGDERDIIIYSFVLSSPDQKRRYVALTGEQGEINKELNAGRVNVAFSRARLQVHCVTSLHPDSWPEGIWIKRYLDYVEKHGEINFFNKALNKFDSYFEEQFYHLVNSELGNEIDIQNQVESCGYKLDFVLTNRRNNKRLAVECDGPTHFEDENSDIYTSSDIERQSILERAGWKFYRLAYSLWVDDEFDKNQIITDIKEELDLDEEEVIENIINNPTEEENDILVEEPIIEAVAVEQIISKGEIVQEVMFKKEIVVESGQLDLLNKTEKDKRKLNPKVKRAVKKKSVDDSFKELFRFNYDNYRDLVVSKTKKNCIWINEYSKNGDYIGFTQRGFGFQVGKQEDFLNLVNDTLNNEKENQMGWLDECDAKLIIAPIEITPGKNAVDIRKYVENDRYKGFTKKGFRFETGKLRDFASELISYTNSNK